MLELRVYGKTELSEMFGTAGMQALQRKMERYGIAFEVNGRGENAVFTIKEIEDPFKIYCITELDFDGRTDFVKVRNFLHYFFNIFCIFQCALRRIFIHCITSFCR